MTDTKIIGSSSPFSPMSVLQAPSQTELSQAYSQHSLHRSVSQLIDRKSLMMEEGSWDNPLGHDSGLVRTEIFLFVNERYTAEQWWHCYTTVAATSAYLPFHFKPWWCFGRILSRTCFWLLWVNWFVLHILTCYFLMFVDGCKLRIVARKAWYFGRNLKCVKRLYKRTWG